VSLEEDLEWMRDQVLAALAKTYVTNTPGQDNT
jgi:hypothetical protein